MAEEFWKSSPFGEDSIFHPNWEEKQRQSRLLLQQISEIDAITIEKGDLRAQMHQSTIIYDNLDPAKFRPPIYDLPPIESNFETVTITVSVSVKGIAESIYITVNGQKQRASKWITNYITVVDLNIPKKEKKKEFEITAEITDFIGSKAFDTKKILATIDITGEVLETKEVELNECGYTISNEYLQGVNVVTSRTDNEVKSGGLLKKPVLAIVLHRTVGSSIGGAISHSKGTHFYIEGGRSGNDGEIFQALSLKNSSNHIFNETTRISHFDVKTENSIGIEVVGLAYYKKDEKIYQNFGEKLELPTPPPLTKAYLDKNGKENFWDPLTDAQIRSVACLVKTLMKEYDIKPEMILTHEEIQQKTAGEGQAVKDAIFSYIIDK